MKSLTIGKRIVLGFSSVLALLVILAGVALYEMNTGENRANEIDAYVVPVNDKASQLLAEMDEFRLNARVYGITGTEADLRLTQQGLAQVQALTAEMRALAAAHPIVASAIPLVREFEQTLSNYEGVLNSTVQRQNEIQQAQTALVDAGTAAGTEIDAFFTSLREAQQRELRNADTTEAANIERAWKIELLQQVSNFITDTRYANVASLAQNDVNILNTALPNLERALAILQELRPTIVNPVNQRQMNAIEQAIRNYQRAAATYIAAHRQLETVNEQRARAGEVAAAATIALIDFEIGRAHV